MESCMARKRRRSDPGPSRPVPGSDCVWRQLRHGWRGRVGSRRRRRWGAGPHPDDYLRAGQFYRHARGRRKRCVARARRRAARRRAARRRAARRPRIRCAAVRSRSGPDARPLRGPGTVRRPGILPRRWRIPRSGRRPGWWRVSRSKSVRRPGRFRRTWRSRPRRARTGGIRRAGCRCRACPGERPCSRVRAGARFRGRR
jgi:hypothetical protein